MRIDELQQLALAYPQWLPLADAMAKATLVLAAAALTSFGLRRASAAVRHTVWTLGLVGALVLPILSLALPRWEVPVVTIPSQISPAIDGRHTAPTVPEALRAAAIADGQLEDPPERESTPVAVAATASDPSAPPFRPDWPRVLLMLWAAGASIILARLALGLFAVAMMSRRTQRVTDAPWLPLARQLASGIGITRRISYLRSRSATMPMAWGVLRAAVLMPAEADDWPAERLRVVLLHELAHVKRRDCLTHLIAQLACALYWFNPLAWMAARQVRTERERACDDLVLAAGTRGSDYANQLLEMASAMRGGRFPSVLASATLAMARRSQLEGRLMAILDTNIRRSEAGRARTAALAALVAIALFPLASVRPWAYAAAEPTDASDRSTDQSAAAPARQPEPSAGTAAGATHQESTAGIKGGVRGGVAGGVPGGAVEGVVGGIVYGVRDGVVGGVTGGMIEGIAESVGEAVGQALGNPNPNPNSNANSNPNPNPMQSFTADQERKPADPKIVAALTAALTDTDKGVRESALHALVQMRDPAVFEPLMQALTDASPDVRQRAAFGLGTLRDRRAVTPLIGALKDKDAGVRQRAAFALGQMRDPAAVPELITAMRDADKEVRQQAAFALGRLRDPRAIDGLTAALKDSSADVRQQAAFALGQVAR